MVTVLMAMAEAVDEARAQIDAVEELAASGSEMTVYLLHVFVDNPEGASVQQVEAVRKARERLEAHGVDVELLESSGDPVDQILEAAEEYDVDQICIGGRKRSPAGKALFGSVTQDVILGTDVPVLVCTSQTETDS